MYTCVNMCIYIYIYISYLSLYVYIYIYIYIHVHIYMHYLKMGGVGCIDRSMQRRNLRPKVQDEGLAYGAHKTTSQTVINSSASLCCNGWPWQLHLGLQNCVYTYDLGSKGLGRQGILLKHRMSLQ